MVGEERVGEVKVGEAIVEEVRTGEAAKMEEVMDQRKTPQLTTNLIIMLLLPLGTLLPRTTILLLLTLT